MTASPDVEAAEQAAADRAPDLLYSETETELRDSVRSLLAARARPEDVLARVEEYFGNNVHRMEYPEYQAEGWQIGSGAVESACKTVVGQRLKLAGMRWGEAGSHAVCHLRALYRSEKGQWEAFWNRDFSLN